MDNLIEQKVSKISVGQRVRKCAVLAATVCLRLHKIKRPM